MEIVIIGTASWEVALFEQATYILKIAKPFISLSHFLTWILCFFCQKVKLRVGRFAFCPSLLVPVRNPCTVTTTIIRLGPASLLCLEDAGETSTISSRSKIATTNAIQKTKLKLDTLNKGALNLEKK